MRYDPSTNFLPSFIRLESTSQTATILAVSYLIVSGISCPHAILPHPITPMFILSFGEPFISIFTGNIVGIEKTPAVAKALLFMEFRRLRFFIRNPPVNFQVILFFIYYLFKSFRTKK